MKDQLKKYKQIYNKDARAAIGKLKLGQLTDNLRALVAHHMGVPPGGTGDSLEEVPGAAALAGAQNAEESTFVYKGEVDYDGHGDNI